MIFYNVYLPFPESVLLIDELSSQGKVQLWLFSDDYQSFFTYALCMCWLGYRYIQMKMFIYLEILVSPSSLYLSLFVSPLSISHLKVAIFEFYFENMRVLDKSL